MNDVDMDRTALRRHQRFLHEVEQSIREANREILHAHIPQLSTEAFVQLATMVARLRTEYLKTALQLAQQPEVHEGAPLIAALTGQRMAFQEAVHAFEALQRAIERGYVDIVLDGDG